MWLILGDGARDFACYLERLETLDWRGVASGRDETVFLDYISFHLIFYDFLHLRDMADLLVHIAPLKGIK